MTVTTDLRTRRRQSLGAIALQQWCAYGCGTVGFIAVSVQSARLLGVHSFGYFLSVMTAAFVLGQVSLMGTHRIGLRDAAIVRDDPTGLGKVLRQVERVSIRLIPVATVAVFAATACLARGGLGDRLELATVCSLLVTVSAQQRLWSCFLRGAGRQAAANFLDGPSGGPLALLTQACLFGLYGIAYERISVLTALWLMLIGQAVWAVLSCVQGHRFHVVRSRESPPSVMSMLHASWHFSLIQVAAYVSASVELWVASAFVPASDLSLLGGAQRISLALVTPLTAMQIIVCPTIARAFARGDNSAMRAVTTGASTAAAYTCLPLLILVLILPGEVMSLLYGPAFADGGLLLLVLALGQAANVLTGICGPLLTMTGHESTVAKVTAVGLAVRLILDLAIADTIGVTGLVVVGATMSAATWVYLTREAQRLTGLRCTPSINPRVALQLRGVAA